MWVVCTCCRMCAIIASLNLSPRNASKGSGCEATHWVPSYRFTSVFSACGLSWCKPKTIIASGRNFAFASGCCCCFPNR